MASEQFEKLAAKLKAFGIDPEILLREFDHRIEAKQTAIAREIIDQIPSIKPDLDELTRAVSEKVQLAGVNTDELTETIIGKVLEKLPDTGEAERKRIMNEAGKSIAEFMGNMEKRVEGMVRPLVESALMEQRESMITAVREEMNKRQEQIMANLTGGGEGNGQPRAAGKWGQIPWEHLTPLLEKMVTGGQDPLAGIDNFLALRERVLALEPHGPDINQQFRSASASFLEGIKLGSKVKGGVEPKKLSGPPGGPSKQPAKSSKLHPAVESL